jgi:hypothetical protein
MLNLSFKINIISLLLILFFLVADPVSSAEIKDFSLNVELDYTKINFTLKGTLVDSLKEKQPDLFRISPKVTYAPDYKCIISNQNCKITPLILPITTGPVYGKQPDGSWEIVNNEIKTEKNSEVANSSALITIPEGVNGDFEISFEIIDVIKKRKALYYSLIELDESEQYNINEYYLLQTVPSLDFAYFSIKVPKNFILNENSKFCHHQIGQTKECYKFIKSGEQTYTLEKVSYSGKPYIAGLKVPPYRLINLQLSFERSADFISNFDLLVVSFLFLFVIMLFIGRFISNKLFYFLEISYPLPLYWLIRNYYFKLEALPLHIQDLFFYSGLGYLIYLLIIYVMTIKALKLIR